MACSQPEPGAAVDAWIVDLAVHVVEVGALMPEVLVDLHLRDLLVRVERQVVFEGGQPLLEVGRPVGLVVFGAELVPRVCCGWGMLSRRSRSAVNIRCGG